MTTEPDWAGPASALFRSLNAETRLKILFHLLEGEKSGAKLVALTDIPKTHIGPHMARLVRDNLVSPRREGLLLFYTLTSQKVPAMLDMAQKLFAR